MAPAPLLQVCQLEVRFGGLHALRGIDFDVGPGEVVAIIGPNGAGKTTLFNVLSGIYAPTRGSIRFAGAGLGRRLSQRLAASFLIMGVVFGFFTMLLAANVDRMWDVSIKQQIVYGPQGVALPFDVLRAARAWRHYMAGLPHTERRMGRFYVVSADGHTTLASTRSAAEAEAVCATAVRAGLVGMQGALWSHLRALVVGALAFWAGALALWRQVRGTPTQVARQGIARTFQNNRPFGSMTALENVQVGLDRHAMPRMGAAAWAYVMPAAVLVLWAVVVVGLRWRLWPEAASAAALVAGLVSVVAWTLLLLHLGAMSPRVARQEAERARQAQDWLAFVGLAELADRPAASLAYGHLRRLEIARALATRPRLLLLDEPAAGLNHTETQALMALIGRICSRGIAVLLIEHDMKLVMDLSDRVLVLEYGRRIACATPAEVQNDPRVIAAYLGEDGAMAEACASV